MRSKYYEQKKKRVREDHLLRLSQCVLFVIDDQMIDRFNLISSTIFPHKSPESTSYFTWMYTNKYRMYKQNCNDQIIERFER